VSDEGAAVKRGRGRPKGSAKSAGSAQSLEPASHELPADEPAVTHKTAKSDPLRGAAAAATVEKPQGRKSVAGSKISKAASLKQAQADSTAPAKAGKGAAAAASSKGARAPSSKGATAAAAASQEEEPAWGAVEGAEVAGSGATLQSNPNSRKSSKARSAAAAAGAADAAAAAALPAAAEVAAAAGVVLPQFEVGDAPLPYAAAAALRAQAAADGVAAAAAAAAAAGAMPVMPLPLVAGAMGVDGTQAAEASEFLQLQVSCSDTYTLLSCDATVYVFVWTCSSACVPQMHFFLSAHSSRSCTWAHELSAGGGTRFRCKLLC
jgi:hypothetical protein